MEAAMSGSTMRGETLMIPSVLRGQRQGVGGA